MQSTADRRKNQTERGQGWIEFTLALPALVILFLGLVEVGLTMRAKLVLTNANREAARYASHGAFTDEQITERAIISFAEQLPARLTGEGANTSIMITRFHVPTGGAEAEVESHYITGTLTYTTRSGEVRATPSKLGEKPEELLAYAQDLQLQNVDYLTTNDVVIVETYYHHKQVLNAPFVSQFIPEPIILYERTAMRISRPRPRAHD